MFGDYFACNKRIVNATPAGSASLAASAGDAVAASAGQASDPDVLTSTFRMKNGEVHVLIWNHGEEGKLLEQLGRMAENPDLDFSWSDAEFVSGEIRRMQMQHEQQG